ncbi:hypothetical protein TZ53_25005 (plasmid) [Sphingobium sp. YBL2]|nr:hypothetical protein TZ53_25005 [Sphingobium sp. YBL2]
MLYDIWTNPTESMNSDSLEIIDGHGPLPLLQDQANARASVPARVERDMNRANGGGRPCALRYTGQQGRIANISMS